MEATAEQQTAAEKVVEAGLIMRKCVRDAERLGLDVHVQVWSSGDGSEVDVRVKLVEETELARMPKEGKK